MYFEKVILSYLLFSFKNIQNNFARQNRLTFCGIRNLNALERILRQTRAGVLAAKNFDVRSERTGIIQPNQSKR